MKRKHRDDKTGLLLLLLVPTLSVVGVIQGVVRNGVTGPWTPNEYLEPTAMAQTLVNVSTPTRCDLLLYDPSATADSSFSSDLLPFAAL